MTVMPMVWEYSNRFVFCAVVIVALPCSALSCWERVRVRAACTGSKTRLPDGLQIQGEARQLRLARDGFRSFQNLNLRVSRAMDVNEAIRGSIESIRNPNRTPFSMYSSILRLSRLLGVSELRAQFEDEVRGNGRKPSSTLLRRESSPDRLFSSPGGVRGAQWHHWARSKSNVEEPRAKPAAILLWPKVPNQHGSQRFWISCRYALTVGRRYCSSKSPLSVAFDAQGVVYRTQCLQLRRRSVICTKRAQPEDYREQMASPVPSGGIRMKSCLRFRTLWVVTGKTPAISVAPTD